MPLAQAKVFYYDFVEIKSWIYELVMSDLGLAFVGTKNSNIEASILGFYPNHILIQDSKKLAPYVQQLKEYFAGIRRSFTVLIDYSSFGTPFQNQVVKMIENIPYGTTISYNDLAASINGSTSVRSVAHAVALNPSLIFIPSHRVVLAPDKVGSYRMGEKEKQRLINLEEGYLNAAN